MPAVLMAFFFFFNKCSSLWVPGLQVMQYKWWWLLLSNLCRYTLNDSVAVRKLPPCTELKPNITAALFSSFYSFLFHAVIHDAQQKHTCTVQHMQEMYTHITQNVCAVKTWSTFHHVVSKGCECECVCSPTRKSSREASLMLPMFDLCVCVCQRVQRR